MKVEVTIEQDIPNRLYCTKQRGNCDRVTEYEDGGYWCSLYDVNLWVEKEGKLLKCSKCLNDLRYALGGNIR